MKGTEYISYIADKVKLYVEKTGKKPERIILSKWYFHKLKKELDYATTMETLSQVEISTIFGIPIVVRDRSKIPNWQHIYLEPDWRNVE